MSGNFRGFPGGFRGVRGTIIDMFKRQFLKFQTASKALQQSLRSFRRASGALQRVQGGIMGFSESFMNLSVGFRKPQVRHRRPEGISGGRQVFTKHFQSQLSAPGGFQRRFKTFSRFYKGFMTFQTDYACRSNDL